MTPEILFRKHTLPNGLDLILHRDGSVPIVAVNLWYHVGSKNERPGRTGFAHLFEHLMFEGSEHYPHAYFRPLQEVGGTLNGSTSCDRTNYWEVVPSNALEVALFMESDRMGYLLPGLTQQKLDNQRDVVKNERRQNYENRPYGLASQHLFEALFPPEHPYHWLTIGSMDDLTAASMADVNEFFTRYCHPANASLCIAGDIDFERARELAEAYFGEIPAGPAVGPVEAPLPPVTRCQVDREDRVELPRLYLAWLTPRGFAPGDAELDLLADILANGKVSRLYRALVYDRRIAQEVAATQHSRELAGFFQITATARPGHSLAELDAVISEELARLRETPPDDAELARARHRFEADFVFRLQTVGGFGGRSDQLNAYNVWLNDPGFLANDQARYERVAAADLQRVAHQYLDPARRVSLWIVPRQTGA